MNNSSLQLKLSQKQIVKNKVLYTFFLFLVCFLLFSSQNVHAAGISLSTFPTTLHLRAQPGTEAKAGLVIENKGSESLTLNIVLQPFVPDNEAEGKLKYIEAIPPMLQNVQVMDSETAITTLELGPKQKKNLGLRVNVSPNEPAADYYFSVVFLSDKEVPLEGTTDEATAVSKVQAGIATNALLAVGPKELPNGTLEEFSTEFYRDSGPVPFTVRVRNNGSHYMTPQGVILIKNMFGQTVGKVDMKNANILAKSSRTLVSTNNESSASKISANSSPTAVWGEKFLLGFYSAELSIALSEDGPVLTHSTKFLALPVSFLAGLTIVIIIISLIAIRVRKTLKQT